MSSVFILIFNIINLSYIENIVIKRYTKIAPNMLYVYA